LSLTRLATWLLLAPVATLIAGITGCEAAKAYYDWRVRGMCDKDGGLIVYQQLPVTAEVLAELTSTHGHIRLPYESQEPLQTPAYFEITSVPLREGYVTLMRHEILVVRRSDSKILARVVSYGRSGGDFPFTGDAASSFSCPAIDGDFLRRVIVVQGER
jgi:hypothetical protein